MTHGLHYSQRRDLIQHLIQDKDPQGLRVKRKTTTPGVNILGASHRHRSWSRTSCQRPLTKTRPAEEIDETHRTLNLGEEGREISFKEAEKLPYLPAVVSESTQLHHSSQYQVNSLEKHSLKAINSHHILSLKSLFIVSVQEA